MGHFSGSRRTSSLINLFQVIWGGPKEVLKLSENCRLTGPRSMHSACEVHAAWSWRKPISISIWVFKWAVPLSRGSPPCQLTPFSHGTLTNPLWNGVRRGQFMQFKQLKVFTVSGINRKGVFLTLLSAQVLLQRRCCLTSPIPPEASILCGSCVPQTGTPG